MNIVLIDNLSKVRELCSDPELFYRIKEGDIDFDSWYPGLDFSYWGMYMEGELVGFWAVKPFNDSTLEIHCNIPQRFREKAAPKAGLAFYGWFVEQFDDKWQKLIAFVPENYRDVCNYCLKHGMTFEGCLEKAIVKSGELVDLYIYGIQRKHIALFLEG